MIAKNNVFNLRYSTKNNWRGQIGHTKYFCMFDSVRSCVRAVAVLIFRTYYNIGCRSIRDIIFRFAPPSENDSVLYMNYVARGCSMSPDDIPLTDVSKVNLLYYMARFETGVILNKELISDVLLNENLDLN